MRRYNYIHAIYNVPGLTFNIFIDPETTF